MKRFYVISENKREDFYYVDDKFTKMYAPDTLFHQNINHSHVFLTERTVPFMDTSNKMIGTGKAYTKKEMLELHYTTKEIIKQKKTKHKKTKKTKGKSIAELTKIIDKAERETEIINLSKERRIISRLKLLEERPELFDYNSDCYNKTTSNDGLSKFNVIGIEGEFCIINNGMRVYLFDNEITACMVVFFKYFYPTDKRYFKADLGEEYTNQEPLLKCP